MPILLKDEKYSECVDVLDQREEWTYKSILLLDCAMLFQHHLMSPLSLNQLQLRAISWPDQPASHLSPVPSSDDTMPGVKIPCYGDQLTRVRLAGSKDLRVGCHSASQRLDHLYPLCIVDWHTKRSFLKVFNMKIRTDLLSNYHKHTYLNDCLNHILSLSLEK